MQWCDAVRCGAVQCSVQCLLLTDKGGRVDRRVIEHAEDVTLPPRWARALRLSTVEARTPLVPYPDVSSQIALRNIPSGMRLQTAA